MAVLAAGIRPTGQVGQLPILTDIPVMGSDIALFTVSVEGESPMAEAVAVPTAVAGGVGVGNPLNSQVEGGFLPPPVFLTCLYKT